MQLTPSSKSAFFAGMALSLVAWMSLFKLDELAKLFRVRRFVSQRKVELWMNENKALTLLGTEFVNFGVHGVTGADSVTFALGSTFFNAIMIFIGLPLKFFFANKRKGIGKLHIVKQVSRNSDVA